MSDNTTVVSYITKQGGTTSVSMYLLAKEVLIAARDANIFLRAKHIPGELNALADLLSRMNSVVDALSITWDNPNVDLFATRLNNLFAVIVSTMADHLAVEVDAMSISLKGMYAFIHPPFDDVGASNREIKQGSSLRTDPDRPEMAQSVLVRHTDRAAGRLSFGPAPQERYLDPAPQPPETPVATTSAPTCLETVQRSRQAKGVSSRCRANLARRRQSSRAVYDSKWRIFSLWCGERVVDPLKVSVQQLAEFLLYLFHEKGLNPRNIKGYRSAISSTIL